MGTSGAINAGIRYAAPWTVGAGVTVTDLGASNGQAFDISDAGLAVGYSFFGGQGHVALWTIRGATVALRDLGTLPGGSFSVADAINRRGQIAGISDLATGTTHAVVWTLSEAGTSMLDPGAVLEGGSSDALDPNDQGEVVGDRQTAAFRSHAILRSLTRTGATVRDPGAPREFRFSGAYGISNNGEVIGGATEIPEGRREGHGFLWTAQGGMVVLPSPGFGRSLDPFLADCSLAEGINDGGRIVGRSWAGAANHATTWTVGHN